MRTGAQSGNSVGGAACGEREMDGQGTLFTLLGLKITVPLAASATAGVVTFVGGLYKLIERWLTLTGQEAASSPLKVSGMMFP